MPKRKFDWKVFVICLVIVYAAAFIGSVFTSQNTSSSWYNSIKPPITPPNFVFPVVWNILFFLIACSLYFAWIAKFKSKSECKNSKRDVAIIFGVNLLLNMAWSFLFFFLRLPIAAFLELIVLWVSILSMIWITFPIRKLSAYLLIPYAAWVAFAGVLNYLAAFA